MSTTRRTTALVAAAALSSAAAWAGLSPAARASAPAAPGAPSASTGAITWHPAGTWKPDPARYGVAEQANVPVTMSDGTVLRADVYTPTDPATGKEAAGPFPVLLTQTPYGKSALGADTYFVQRGYMEVVADVRGTGDSEGTYGLFDPVQADDGAALVRWSAHLAHADGKVGLFGASYLGINQFLTVGRLGPDSPVKAIFPVISANDIYRDTAFQGGLFDGEFNTAYTGLVAGAQAGEPAAETAAAPSSGSAAALGETQLEHEGALASYYGPTAADVELNGPETFDGAYWLDRSPTTYLSQVVADHVPAFLVGGWYDLFQHGEPLNYVALQNLYDHRPAGAPMLADQAVTGRYQLLMGPWYHLTAGQGVNLDQIELEWFDTWLEGRSTAMASTTTPLHMNLLGTSRYVDTATWPSAGAAAATTLWMGANGALSPAAPAAATGAANLVFTGASAPCDRQTSQWSMGGDNLALGTAGLGADPCTTQDNDIQAGPGALTFTTAPMGADTVLAGPMNVSVAATDTVGDAEWIANVEEVAPGGQSTPLSAGALLGSDRALDPSRSWAGPGGRLLLPWHPYTSDSARPVVPRAVTRYDIEVFPTFALVPKGYQLRVTLSTSDTPHLLPTPRQLADLAGGVYGVQLNRTTPSYLEAVLLPAARF